MPIHSRLYERARQFLVALAVKARIALRQSYNRSAPRLAARVGRYAHARQFRRMCRALRTLKGPTGRVLRDVGRKLGAVVQGPPRDRISDRMRMGWAGEGDRRPEGGERQTGSRLHQGIHGKWGLHFQ